MMRATLVQLGHTAHRVPSTELSALHGARLQQRVSGLRRVEHRTAAHAGAAAEGRAVAHVAEVVRAVQKSRPLAQAEA